MPKQTPSKSNLASLSCPALLILVIGLTLLPAVSAQSQARSVSCLGRLEPGDGVRVIASPAPEGGVIAELKVSEGVWVEADQVLATLTSHPLKLAEVSRLKAEFDYASVEASRLRSLSSGAAASKARVESAEINVRVARAALSAARARLELSVVRAPMAGQVLEIHARRGERVGPMGVLELGDTGRMYAVAEVYETDIGSVAKGQSATVLSAALSAPLKGKVERIGLKVGRMDVLGTDPIAKTDARVVEVRIRLDDAAAVASLTNLQVEVKIGP
jgi:HlyD family secretion protein